MTSGESERMYARHVPHTFSYLSPKQSNTPEPRKIPGSFLCTPDWIRTSDLQSRSLTLYPTELRVGSKFHVSWRCNIRKYLYTVGLDSPHSLASSDTFILPSTYAA